MLSFKLFITTSPFSVGGIEFKINETSFNNVSFSFKKSLKQSLFKLYFLSSEFFLF